MKILTAFAIFKVFLLVTDARTIPVENIKTVTCLYMNEMTISNASLNIEDIDPTICTHLMVDDSVVLPIIEKYRIPSMEMPRGDGVLQKLQRLKQINSGLKLILQMPDWRFDRLQDIWHSEKPNITVDSMRLLKEMGFDGLDLHIDYFPSDKLDDLGDLICELKTAFEKNNFLLTITRTEFASDFGLAPGDERSYNDIEIVKCCDHYKILSLVRPTSVTQRLSSLNDMKRKVDKYIRRGFPPHKIVISFPTIVNLYALSDPQHTEPGGEIDILSTSEIMGILPGIIFHRDLMREMQNSSLGWKIRRDEETKEPYAFTKTGLWTSYDDKISIEFKANYVLEKGLGGIAILPLNMEDSEGIAGEGRFPLTRAAYNTFRGLQTVDTIL